MPDLRAWPRPVLPLGFAVFAAVVGGLLLTLSVPSLSWWPLAFVAIPFVLVALAGRRSWAALLVGFGFGAAFYLVNVSFTARYLGPVPWLALSLFEAALTAALSIPIALAYRWLPRLTGRLWVRLVALPALVAGLWTMREQVLGTWPYGGFPWGRVGVSQVDGPLAPFGSWVGMSGITFAVVFVCAAAIEYARARRFTDLRTALPAVLAFAIAAVIPQFPTTPAGTIRIGAVQGDGPTGYFDPRAPGEVLDTQLRATAPLDGKSMDLLIWPEGSMDEDPTRDPTTAAALDSLAHRLHAPLLVGAITKRGADWFNSSLLWEAGAENPVAGYDKRHPVPFGEYVPDRWFYRALAPGLIDLIQRDYTPGTRPPVIDLHGVGIGLGICFDVIYDDVVWDGARGGAQFYAFQTNNADFRGTDENLQQLAFARMAAIETGRSVVNISTVGTSQIIAPDGSEIAGLTAGAPGALLDDVPLRTGSTPAVIIGPAINLLLEWGSAAAIAALGIAVGILRRRTPKTTDAGPEGTGIDDAPDLRR